jgi:hypothetical protein
MQRVMLTLLFTTVIVVISPITLLAQRSIFEPGPLVDHPVSHPATLRSSSAWKKGVGGFGEGLSGEYLKLRGFNEIYEIKNRRGNGIDRLAVKRRPNGEIMDVKIVEVKTTRSSKPKLGDTKYGGRQMSRGWLAANFRMMRNSGDPTLRSLALEISRFRKAANVSIESMGEVMHVNPRTGKLTGYAADGRTTKYEQSIERLLRKIQSKVRSKTVRDWASRTLAQYDQIQATQMKEYLGKTVAQQSRKTILSNATKNSGSPQTAISTILNLTKSGRLTRIFTRSAGPIAVFLAALMDAKEVFDIEYAYRTGEISARHRNIQLALKLGGIGGAFAGASSGAVVGAWIGTMGGPLAPITVPIGGFLGGVIGGVGGYFGGSALANYAATAWYDSIDSSVRERFELGWVKGN